MRAQGFLATLFLFALLAFFTSPLYAYSDKERLWLGLNAQQSLSQDEKWLGFIFTQLRLYNEPHPVQIGLLEGGLGYQFLPKQTIWIGYRWMGNNPNNGFYQENRLFQQIILQKHITMFRYISRTRIEEIERTNQSQIAFRLRQRLALEIDKDLYLKTFPFIYDEVFIPFNQTDYSSNRFISENRLFLGVNQYRSKTSWWELGYINQYQMPTPLSPQYDMSHVLSITYNFN